MFRFGSRSLERREGISTRCVEILDHAILISPVDFGIPKDGGLRTSERQNELFLYKVSLCDGYRVKSKHQSGRAFDVYAFVDGKASWEPEHLSMVAGAILQASSELGYPLKWGGLFRPFKSHKDYDHGWDMGHFEEL